jgi:hypothetical protein
MPSRTSRSELGSIYLMDFEYTIAEMGTGTSKVTAGLKLELNGSYGQFSILHMNQDGVIR